MNRKGFALPIVLAIAIVGALVLGGGVFIFEKSGNLNKAPLPSSTSTPEASMVASSSGYVSGTVIKTSTPGASYAESVFDIPYPLSWQAQNTSIFLTKVAFGEVPVPEPDYAQVGQYAGTNPNFKDSNRPSYVFKIGEKVKAIALTFKLTTAAAAGNSNSILSIRRLLNEAGEFKAPNYPGWGKALQAYDTLENQVVYFLIPDDQNRFEFMTGGGAPIYFSVSLTSDGKVKVAKEPTSENGNNYNNLPVPVVKTPIPSIAANMPLKVTLTNPISSVTVNRGDNMTVNWTYTGGTPQQNQIYIYLSSSSGPIQTIIAPLKDLQKTFKVMVPPGSYSLSVPYYAANTTASKTTVTVTGPTPIVSLASSSIELDEEEIISDGICYALGYVYVVDSFNFGLRGKKVEVKSNKPSDIIKASALYSTSDGSIEFNVKSTTIGTSTLTAYIEGVPLPGKIDLSVSDAKLNDCSANTFDDYYGY